ncbi:PepSY domain-containing protein [Kamptonema sp. UHCC 0994]|uniref:PepSY domain-containing protein n=1 Tax=Kamptonema sp. UHCC 0994 TaxID=3031329 RepID=UPI0023B8A4A1|nr:PepSY domain-containing protein [Kamptonema sp. UHCC 0994]MDF0554885.1 PepSY domain-containing protein [Kamptonema sp. UHCC 0994]
MATANFRKLHRQIAPIIFLPLLLTALTGVAYRLAENWFGIEGDASEIFIKIHQGKFLGDRLVPIYVFMVALGTIGIIVSGLTMTKLFGGNRPERQGAKLDFRKVHRIVAPIIFLPLTVSALTGLLHTIGITWFNISDRTGEILLNIHQGEYLGEFLMPIYVLLVGLGAILMLISGINMTGIFRKKRQSQTDDNS